MSDTREPIIQTTVRMPVSLHKQLTDEIQERKYTERKISIDKAIQEAVGLWLVAGRETNEIESDLGALLRDEEDPNREIVLKALQNWKSKKSRPREIPDEPGKEAGRPRRVHNR